VTSAHSMQLPMFGVAYAFTGIVSGTLWLWEGRNRLLPALSGVIVATAALNAYVEGWEVLRQIPPAYAVPFLLVTFLVPYSILSIQLMEQLEGMRWRPALWSSYLPIVGFLFLGLGTAVGTRGPAANRPLALFLGVTFICVLHVPMFAYGKSSVVRIMRSSGFHGAGTSKLSPAVLRQTIASLGAPMLIVLGIQAAGGDGWTLLGTDAVLSVAIICLFLVLRQQPGRRERVPVGGRPGPCS
jgi:hypothetical protein